MPVHTTDAAKALAWLLAMPVTDAGLLALVGLLALSGVVLSIVRHPRGMRVWRLLVAGCIGAGVGAAAWGIAAVVPLLGGHAVPAAASLLLTGVIVAFAAGMIAVLVVVGFGAHGWRRAGAMATLPAVIAAALLGANLAGPQHSTLGALIAPTRTPVRAAVQIRTTSLADWRGPASMPTHGQVRSIRIPGTRSHFRARAGFVYLPPAALVANAPKLPVVIALSGQSRTAKPRDVLTGGRIAAIMDSIARANHGVAPIVIVPDQLGRSTANPMCVDSALGHVATYLTVDVRRYVFAHFSASHDRRLWTIAGFSEGGTCAIQLGAADSADFGAIVDVSGESGPRNGSVAHTIAVGFGGSRVAYAHAQPAWLLREHRPYLATRALFSVGALDRDYGRVAPTLTKLAAAAGMDASFRRLTGLNHNWRTGAAGFRWSFQALVSWWGLAGSAS